MAIACEDWEKPRRVGQDGGRGKTPGKGEEGEGLAFQKVTTAHEEIPEQAPLDLELAALVWQAAKGLNPNEYTLLDLQLRKGLEP